MNHTLSKFHGGVHPPEHKSESTGRPIARAPLPARLIVPVLQHIGEAAHPCVAVGDPVEKGQMIARAEGYVSVAAHAPTSGTVVAIAPHPMPHPSGLQDLCIHIEPDGRDSWIERTPTDYRNAHPSTLRNVLRDMGIAGLGGAVFPTFIKLNPGKLLKVPTIVLNGAECEPWITCDDMTMREQADGILQGARIMRHLLQSDTVLVGIEDNKPEAIAAMRAATRRVDFPVDVVVVPTLYPSGGSKQLVKLLTGHEVPSGGRSTDVGVATFNVGTALAVHRAIDHGEPMISRMVTLTGNVSQPQNFEVLIGTPIADVLALGGNNPQPATGYIMGGPMMGFQLPDLNAPVVKATNCILVKSAQLFPPLPSPMECIRCTRCADACPAELQPQELYWFARSDHFEKAQNYRLFDCIECGCCNYVCPSHIPLVHYYRYAKSEISTLKAAENAANHARNRHESRLARLEREQRERAEKLAQKSASRASPDDAAAAAAKQATIQAALARAQTQTQAEAQPQGEAQPQPDTQHE